MLDIFASLAEGSI